MEVLAIGALVLSLTSLLRSFDKSLVVRVPLVIGADDIGRHLGSVEWRLMEAARSSAEKNDIEAARAAIEAIEILRRIEGEP